MLLFVRKIIWIQGAGSENGKQAFSAKMRIVLGQILGVRDVQERRKELKSKRVAS